MREPDGVIELTEELHRLRAGIQAMIDGDAPERPIWANEVYTGKNRRCVHMAWLYDGCSQCLDDYLTRLLTNNTNPKHAP